MGEDGKKVTSSREKVEMLNAFFAYVFAEKEKKHQSNLSKTILKKTD